MKFTETYKCLALSTGHLSPAAAELLYSMDHSMVLTRDTGFFVKLYTDNDDPAGWAKKNPELHTLLYFVRRCGFQMVEFDADAPVEDFLPLYEW